MFFFTQGIEDVFSRGVKDAFFSQGIKDVFFFFTEGIEDIFLSRN